MKRFSEFIINTISVIFFIREKVALVFGIMLICFLIFSGAQYSPDSSISDYSWKSRIRNDHPRLFFNNSSFLKIKERALNEEFTVFKEMKNRIDLLIGQEIEFKDPLISDGTASEDHQYGTLAAEAAFIYLVLGDEKYLDLSKELLIRIIGYYNFRNAAQLYISGNTFSRINALAAYDWIYNDLTEEERTDIGRSLFYSINDMFLTDWRETWKNTDYRITGFYGIQSLTWYTGIVFHKEGIDDDLASELLIKGYDDYIALLKHRRNVAGEHGGAASASLNYAMGLYPLAEFNFFHTFNSATGLDISKQWPHVPHFLHYVLWNWLPGDKEFGYGDAHHITNDLPLAHYYFGNILVASMHQHISQIIHFYGETHPRLISLGKWMLTKIDKLTPVYTPFTGFLLTNTHDEIKPIDPSENMPKAMHFANMGQVFMRSGSGPGDTYALFSAGGILRMHRHYDNNNFVIFKKGFLALDSGTRPQPGLHLSHYYSRTVAHNCITIIMPGEIMPGYWGQAALSEQPLPVPNDGGQNNMMGSEVIAFDENDHYIYIASDATKSYHEDKANLVIREFVFLPPDHFVIFDRVISTDPTFKKRWILHTAGKPAVKPGEFFTDHWEGRLFCRTLLPEESTLTKIGGPGKQFWSGGRNWPMPVLTPDDWRYEVRHTFPPDSLDLLGQWRIEVSPDKPNTNHTFLHLIQVGDLALESMVPSTTVKSDDMTGVRFTYNDKEYEVLFFKNKSAGGKISISHNGHEILEEEFTNQLKKQEVLF